VCVVQGLGKAYVSTQESLSEQVVRLHQALVIRGGRLSGRRSCRCVPRNGSGGRRGRATYGRRRAFLGSIRSSSILGGGICVGWDRHALAIDEVGAQ
jgi:hypothetical protein